MLIVNIFLAVLFVAWPLLTLSQDPGARLQGSFRDVSVSDGKLNGHIVINSDNITCIWRLCTYNYVMYTVSSIVHLNSSAISFTEMSMPYCT